MASGGVASPTDPVGAFGSSDDEIRAIVTEARGRGTYVLAHACGQASIGRDDPSRHDVRNCRTFVMR
ncbi:imidazolonepropionase-like amidohydrolase [Bradyrhizobium sp. USDA 4353]